MKIVITEEQKNKLFIPRKIDERQGQLKKELVKKTKELLSRFNITEIMNHGRIDDYDGVITAEDHLNGAYEKVIINGKNYHGIFSIMDDVNIIVDDEIIDFLNEWEEMLATYLNTIMPQPSDESIYKSEPNVIGRMYRIDITPSKIDISFSYAIVEYINKKGKETITL